MTNISHGAYAKDLDKVYVYWTKHSPERALKVDQCADSYAKALGWKNDQPEYRILRHLAIWRVSRDLLFGKIIIELDFTRVVRDPHTKKEIRKRPADQFRRLEEIDDNIHELIKKLGLLKLPPNR